MESNQTLGVRLATAAHSGNSELVRDLLSQGADANTHAGLASPLFLAAIGCHVEVVRLLLDAGANVDEGANYRSTPLICAVERGDAQMVRMLLAAGADTSIHSEEENWGRDQGTALTQAMAANRREIVEILRAAGATE